MNKPGSGTSVVLLYHRIGLPKMSSLVSGQYVAPMLFRSELDHLIANSWEFTSLCDVIEDQSNGANRFAITFDDGYRSVYDHAFPLLRERNMTGTVYMVTDFIGGINEWDRRAGDMREHIMTKEQMCEMADAGFEIGSHTLSHPHLTAISDNQLALELADSKHKLEDMIGREVVSFSYPYGDRDPRVIQAAKDAGYKNAVSTQIGTVNGCNPFEIPRINVRWNALGPFLMRKIKRAQRASGVLV